MVVKKGGCVLVRSKTKEVALIYRPHYDDYSFPKGHMEGNETTLECAIRETIEETGCDITIINDEPIYINKYTTPKGEDVEVYYYLAEYKEEYQGFIDEKDKEICRWVSIDEVAKLLTYDNNLTMWEKVSKIVAECCALHDN